MKVVNILFFFIVSSVCYILVVEPASPQCKQGKATLKRIMCEADGVNMNVSCKLTPLNRTHKQINIVLYIFKDSNPTLRIKHWLKSSTNAYLPGLYDVDFDVCDLTKDLLSTNPNFGRYFLDNAVSDWREKYDQILHKCPYQGYHYLNFTFTGAPCESIYDSEVYFGRFNKRSDSKTEIMVNPTKNNQKVKPGLLVTLFDEGN